MRKIVAIVMMLSLIFGLCACRMDPPEQTTSTEASTEHSTQAPTGIPTEAPTETPTEAPTEPPAPMQAPVETVIDYSREIVPQGGTTTLTHHTVKCPALTSQTQDAQAINAEIYEYCASSIKTLENYTEGEYIYLIDYRYTNYNGIIGLLLDLTVSFHYGGVFPSYICYFFDSNTGRRLTYEEYAQALNLSEPQIRQALDESGLALTTNYTISWVAADETITYIMAESFDFLDNVSLFTLEDSILG